MSNEPRVSIVMPVYKVERYLPAAVASIQAQHYTNWELIAVNDASPDGCLSLLQKISREERRLRVISLSVNGGLPHARNIGMDAAQGKYIYFLDSDDALVDENALTELVALAERDQLDAVLFDSIAVAEDEELLALAESLVPRHKTVHTQVLDGIAMYKELSQTHDQSVQVGRCFWRLERLREKNLRFLENMIIMEDDLFYYEALLMVQRVRTINTAYHLYRIRSDSMSDRSPNKSYCKELQATLVEYVERYKFLERQAVALEPEIDYLYFLQQEFYKTLTREYRRWRKRGSQSVSLRRPEYRHVFAKLADDYEKRSITLAMLQSLSAYRDIKVIGDGNYQQAAAEILPFLQVPYELIYDDKFHVDVNQLVDRMSGESMTILFTGLYDDLKPLLEDFSLRENIDFINGLLLL